GLSRPTFIKDVFSNFNYIIIIDSSASMSATDMDGRSRLDVAKDKAREIIQNFAESDMAMIITSDSKTHISAPLSRDKNMLNGKIKDIAPAETPTDLYDAFVVVLSVLKQQKIDKIYLISDGANIGLERLNEEHKITDDTFPEVEFVSIGTGSDNVGIIDMDINSSSDAKGSFQVFARIENFSPSIKTGEIELYNSDKLIDVKDFSIREKENISVIFDDLKLEQGLVYIKLSLDDSLTIDNNAYAYMKPPEKISVLLVTDENVFLENVLSVNKAVSYMKLKKEDYNENEDHSRFDVVIFDSFTPKSLPKTNLFLINSELRDLNIVKVATKSGQRVEEMPKIIDYDKTHPVMKYINIDNTAIAKATLFSTPDWLQRIVDTENTSLIYAGERANQRVLLLSFNLKDSDFILKSTFPIFVYNSMFWLSDHFEKRSAAFYRTGDPIRRRVYGQDIIEVTTPNMSVIKTKVFNDELFFDDSKWVGLYTLKGTADYEDFFIANLLNERESDITPSPFIMVGGKKVEPTGRITVRKELWKNFVIIALFFIMLEWWIYHRKVFE
ncbi:VWA domain-containing protein, partial [Thermodesulfobacteriota bacterium]